MQPVNMGESHAVGAEAVVLPRASVTRSAGYPSLVRARVSSGSPLESVIGFSRAVRVGEQVFVAATAPIWPDGYFDDDVGAQCRRCLQIIENALHRVDAAIGDVVRTRVFLIDRADGEAVGAIHGEVFGKVRPATGFIVVRGFLDPRWRVEVEADAIVTGP